MIRHFLQGVPAKDKNVRFRCVQFVTNMVNTLQEMDDALYEDLRSNMCQRLYDKEPSIRYYAALALSKLDDPNDDPENSVTSLLIHSLQHDTSAEVRRTILLNVNKTSATRRYLLERALDTNAINRRNVYSRVMEEIGDFRQLSIHQRERLLLWGLKDRDVSVRKAATNMFLEQWLETTENSIQEVLERLDVINSSVAETAMSVFFSNRKDAIDSLDFTDELWQSLTPETAFLIRTFNDYCIKENLTQKQEQKLPELTKLGFFIEHYVSVLGKEPDNIDVQYIVEQLLAIAETYDYADEVGRRKILTTLREFTTNLSLPDSIIKKCVSIIRKLSVKESDFSQVVVELISDVKDQFEENMEELDEDSDERLILENSCIIRCLVLAQSMLEYIILPLESNQYLMSLVDTLIIPSIRSHFADIRENGLKCLGLCCLVSKKLAAEYLLLFAKCFAQGDEQIKEHSLKAITDILMIHGREIIEMEECELEEKQIYKLYCRTLQDGNLDETQSLGALSLCKLLLNGVFDEPELIKACVLQYFGYDSVYNPKLRQILSFCLPVFSYSSAEKQKIMASVVVESLRKLNNIYESLEEDGEMIQPSQILQQLIDWTDPTKVVVSNSNGLTQGGGYDDIHANVGIEMLWRIEDTRSKEERKALCLGLSRLKITPKIGLVTLNELRDEILSVVASKNVTEGTLKNALARFLKEVEANIVKAEKIQGSASTEDLPKTKGDNTQSEPSSRRQSTTNDSGSSSRRQSGANNVTQEENRDSSSRPQDGENGLTQEESQEPSSRPQSTVQEHVDASNSNSKTNKSTAGSRKKGNGSASSIANHQRKSRFLVTKDLEMPDKHKGKETDDSVDVDTSSSEEETEEHTTKHVTQKRTRIPKGARSEDESGSDTEPENQTASVKPFHGRRKPIATTDSKPTKDNSESDSTTDTENGSSKEEVTKPITKKRKSIANRKNDDSDSELSDLSDFGSEQDISGIDVIEAPETTRSTRGRRRAAKPAIIEDSESDLDSDSSSDSGSDSDSDDDSE